MARNDPIYLAAQSCYVVAPNERGEWLFVLRGDTGYKDNEWALPGGHVIPNEPIDIAASRELEEETGLTINPDNLKLALVMQRNKRPEGIEDRIDYYFMAKDSQNTASNREPRHTAIGWFDPQSLPPNTVDFTRVACASILASKKFVTFNFPETS